MLDINIIQKALNHAEECIPHESCGLVVNSGGTTQYLPCTNISNIPGTFTIDPLDYAKAEDLGIIECIVHSHYGISPEPSQADLVGCEHSKLPWLIVSQPTGTYKLIEPSGYTAPLKGREFIPGIFDCYSLARDYYKEVLNIPIPNYERNGLWWLEGKNVIEDNFSTSGFEKLNIDNLEKHDLLLIQCGNVIDHIAIYIGDNKILHHLYNRLSKEDILGSYWLKHTRCVARYTGLK